MIKVDKGHVEVMGEHDIVEAETIMLLLSLFDNVPHSLKRILQCVIDYIEGKIEDD